MRLPCTRISLTHWIIPHVTTQVLISSFKANRILTYPHANCWVVHIERLPFYKC